MMLLCSSRCCAPSLMVFARPRFSRRLGLFTRVAWVKRTWSPRWVYGSSFRIRAVDSVHEAYVRVHGGSSAIVARSTYGLCRIGRGRCSSDYPRCESPKLLPPRTLWTIQTSLKRPLDLIVPPRHVERARRLSSTEKTNEDTKKPRGVAEPPTHTILKHTVFYWHNKSLPFLCVDLRKYEILSAMVSGCHTIYAKINLRFSTILTIHRTIDLPTFKVFWTPQNSPCNTPDNLVSPNFTR